MTSNVVRFQSTNSGDCPDKTLTWGVDRIPLISTLDQISPVMILKLNELEQLTDGGNTPQLLLDVQNATQANVGSVIVSLTNSSPFLSDEVLQAIANVDAPFSQEQIRDVLVSNPHSARSLGVQTALDNRANPLPQAYRDAINNQIGVTTDRDNRQTELADLVGRYDLTLHELLYNYTMDSTATLQEFASWYKHPFNPTYRYQLAEMYFDREEWSKYTETVTEIPQAISLNARQQEYHTAFIQLFAELHTWQLAGENVYGDISKKDWLLAFANTLSTYPTRVKAYLALHDVILDPPNVYIDPIPANEAFVTQKSSNWINMENESSMINLYPNPTKNKVTLEWKEEPKEASVLVYNTFGVEVHNQKWIEGTPLSIDVGAWRQGAYFVIIQTETETIRRNLLIGR